MDFAVHSGACQTGMGDTSTSRRSMGGESWELRRHVYGLSGVLAAFCRCVGGLYCSLLAYLSHRQSYADTSSSCTQSPRQILLLANVNP